MDRLLVGLAGLAGLAGVALSAVAAHGPGAANPNVDIAARFLLVHAAALLGTAALSGGVISPRLAGMAGLAIGLGLALFCGDLIYRAFAGRGLFPYSAPSGGFALMAGWLLIAIAGLIGHRG